MSFRIGRTLPPAAAPIYIRDIVSGIAGLFRGAKTIARFEQELRDHFRVRHCFAVSSGKTALTMILQALKAMHPDRDEVLIPAFTCYSVPSAIIRAGLRIRLCDLDRETFDFDYEQLSNILDGDNSRLLCILPVHLFGFPTDIPRIRKMIAGKDIIIVEDAAQAMGGENNRDKLGTLGDVGFFSLGRGKAFSTVEGGIILTGRDDLAGQLEKTVNELGNYGSLELVKLFLYAAALMLLLRPSLFWLPKALPFLRLGETIYDPDFKMRRLSAFQAGLAAGWEGKLHEFSNARLRNASELLNWLKKIGLRPTWTDLRPFSSPIRFPLRVEDVKKRDRILNICERNGLGVSAAYPDSIDRIPELKVQFEGSDFPVAKKTAETLLTLPIHPFVTGNDLERIAELLQSEESQGQ